MNPVLTVQPEPPDSAEAEALMGALDACLNPLYAPEDRHGPSVAALVQACHAGSLIFLVARLDGAAVGCGAVRFVPGEYVEVKRMFVMPQWRGRGVAQAILTHLEGLARQQGFGLLRLETGIHQQEALRLYERAGFTRCGLFGEYTNAASSVCFEKKLVPASEGPAVSPDLVS